MKVTPAFESLPTDRRATARGGPGGSFAQLLEGGAQAHTVLSHRALGFAEAGLLGVHFAHENIALSPSGHSPVGKDAAKSPGLSLTEQVSVAPPQDPPHAAVPSGAAPSLGTSAAAAPAPLLLGPDPATSPVSERSVALEAAGPALPEEPCPAPLRPLAPPPPRRRAPFRVRLLGDGTELVVVVEGDRPGDESILEMETTARALASEYCMSISRLFVKPSVGNAAA